MYTITFRKHGYKPFTKTIKKDLPETMVYGHIIPVKHIHDVIESLLTGWKENNDIKVIKVDSMRVVARVIYDGNKIMIGSKTATLSG